MCRCTAYTALHIIISLFARLQHQAAFHHQPSSKCPCKFSYACRCHTFIYHPPPSTADYKTQAAHTAIKPQKTSSTYNAETTASSHLTVLNNILIL
jgi:hypothetical protein